MIDVLDPIWWFAFYAYTRKDACRWGSRDFSTAPIDESNVGIHVT